MRLEKHIHGFVVFVIILTGIICIYEYFRWPPPSQIARVEPVTDEAPAVGYDVRLVSLDFINSKSYTTLTLKREAGKPVPERLWVTTVFMSTESAPGMSWMTTAEVPVPLRADSPPGESYVSETTQITATASCSWCASPAAPKAGYFARVYVSTEPDKDGPPAEAFAPDITDATPVVVQAARKGRR